MAGGSYSVESTLARQNLGDSTSAADERLELATGPGEVLRPGQDRRHGIKRKDRDRPPFIRVDEGGKRIQLTLFGGPRRGVRRAKSSIRRKKGRNPADDD
jgi:hypothetical protein